MSNKTASVPGVLLLILTLASASLEPNDPEHSQFASVPSPELLPPFEILIVGGERVTNPTKYPFFVRILYGKGSQRPTLKCGGSIISANQIVTAAHCLEGIPFPRLPDYPDQLYIVAGCVIPLIGQNSYPQMSDTCRAIHVDSVRIHPAYYFNESAGQIINDVAVLTLSQNFDFGNKSARNKYIQRIQVAPPYEHFEDVFDSEVITVGSGCTDRTRLEPSPQEYYLHTLTYQALPRELCVTANTSGRVLCAKSNGDPTAGICPGDSGSSLLCRKKGTRYQILCGITSHRRLKSEVDVFMDASFYHKWILDNKTDTDNSDSSNYESEYNYSGIVLLVVVVCWIALVGLVSVGLYRSNFGRIGIDWIQDRLKRKDQHNVSHWQESRSLNVT